MGGVIEKLDRIEYRGYLKYGTKHADVKKLRYPDCEDEFPSLKKP